MDPIIVEQRPEPQQPASQPGGRPPPSELAPAMRHAATRAVVLAAVLVVAGLLFHHLITLVVVTVVTVILAILLCLVTDPLERRGLPRPLGALCGVLVVLAVLGLAMALMVPPITAEISRFVDRLPQMANDLGRHVASVSGGDPAAAGDRIQRALERVSSDPTRFLGPLATIAGGLAGVVSALVVILITAYYMAARPEPLVAGLVRLFPPDRREWAGALLGRLRVAWEGWLKGVAVDMLITGTLLYAGLALVGLEFAFLFAVLSALLVVVPYFGAIAGGIPPVLLALTDSIELAALVLAVYVVVQQIEGNLIIPLVMARVVKLHPAVIALGVVVVSQLFGLVGLIVAVPLISAAVILAEELWVHPLERRQRALRPHVERATDGRRRADA